MFNVRSLSHFAMAGSRCEKKLLVPVLSTAIADVVVTLGKVENILARLSTS
jgi:ABC-type hemin transport system substrate-binding protein